MTEVKGIFDTHAHYDDKAFDEDRDALLESLPGQGIVREVNVGASLASCERTLALTEKYEFIYGAIGIHPNETAQLEQEGACERLRELTPPTAPEQARRSLPPSGRCADTRKPWPSEKSDWTIIGISQSGRFRRNGSPVSWIWPGSLGFR